MALTAVLTQTLLPAVAGGLVPAAELLMISYGARQHIRRNGLQHMHQEMTISRKAGSFTFEESLAQLVRQGLVERQDAIGLGINDGLHRGLVQQRLVVSMIVMQRPRCVSAQQHLVHAEHQRAHMQSLAHPRLEIARSMELVV